ncbi:Hypothetical protein R9X50_00478000 [Acrodontium crateriforme]|uniref:Uncharacterized protein n=1 Tax=Acrodontium crateriforme TaxID=150365 RepID=A0AAQ3R5C8_9PEZI|nr:Hypothetical protein R9X50_00478000 [Acrodontium crateriforme]
MPVVAIGSQPLLGPVVGLCSWTLIMEAWMYATRLPALSKYKVDTSPENCKQSMADKIPASIAWKAENYNHLMEQPTQFFATALALNAMGVSDQVTVGLAWGYVGLRVLHSLVQATSNTIVVRFGLFLSSSITLTALTVKAGLILWGKGLGSAHVEL